MKRPMAGRMGEKEIAETFAGLDVYGMFERHIIALTIFEHCEEAVQMYGMLHHCIVDECKADLLTKLNAYRLGLGKFLAIEAPNEAFHVSGEMKFDRAAGRRQVVMRAQRA